MFTTCKALIWIVFNCVDTILKKYSSTVATIFTGIASAALFGHTLTINFILGISIVFISMHQVTQQQAVQLGLYSLNGFLTFFFPLIFMFDNLNPFYHLFYFIMLNCLRLKNIWSNVSLVNSSYIIILFPVFFTPFKGQGWSTEWWYGNDENST